MAEIDISSQPFYDDTDILEELVDELRSLGYDAAPTNLAHIQESVADPTSWQLQLWVIGDGIVVALAAAALEAVAKRAWAAFRDRGKTPPATGVIFGSKGEVVAHVELPIDDRDD